MTNHLAIWQRLQVRQRSRLVAAAAMALSIFGVPGLSFAAELLAPARSGDPREVLASATTLSDAAMSKENAAGSQPTQIIGQGTARARVTLWDELKAQPLLSPGANGTSALRTGGGK
jgi:hypothetical protein